MRALMYYSNKDVRVCHMPVPEIGTGEILIKVIASGICGSDVMEWYRKDKIPLVLGHEVAGEVVKTGKGVEKFSVNDRVAATHHVPCNTCHYCLKGNHTVCDTLLKGTHFDPGGFAEYIRVPAINVDRGVFRIPDDMTYEEASFMEPLACVLRGQKRAGVKPGCSVLVLGTGIAGLLHVALAKGLGAGLVVAADTIPYRLDMAKKMGADLVLDANDDIATAIGRQNEGYLADIVIVCFEGFLEQGLKSVERGGTILLFAGFSEGAKIPYDINRIFWRTEVNITSTYAAAPKDCATALRLIRAKTINVNDLITHRLSLEEAGAGFQAVADPVTHKCVKVILMPQM